jgi:hypothetical protein
MRSGAGEECPPLLPWFASSGARQRAQRCRLKPQLQGNVDTCARVSIGAGRVSGVTAGRAGPASNANCGKNPAPSAYVKADAIADIAGGGRSRKRCFCSTEHFRHSRFRPACRSASVLAGNRGDMRQPVLGGANTESFCSPMAATRCIAISGVMVAKGNSRSALATASKKR